MKKLTLQTTEYSVPIIRSLLDQFSERTKTIRQYQYYYIIDYILRNSDKNNNCVPLNRNVLANILGVKKEVCSLMLKDLVSNEILNVEKEFNIGENSTCYSVNLQHNYLLAISLNISKFKPLIKIIKRRNEKNEAFKNTKIGSLYTSYISNIDVLNINNIITDLYNMYILLPNGLKMINIVRFERAKSNLYRIKNKDFWVKRPDEKSRIFCNFSILHRKYRSHLTYNGQHLKCVDITNSQPLLAGVMIKDLMVKRKSIIPDDMKLYIEDCERGVFYENFMSEEDAKLENRTDFKKKFFGEVFFSKVTERKTKLKKKFIERYPNVYEEICNIKGGIGSKTYNEFAKQLQRFEASIIVDAVNIPMLKDGYGCFNIYDSIVSHSDEVLSEATKRILAEFKKYDVTPTLKIESFKNY